MHRVKIADHDTVRALPEFFELHGKTSETCALATESIERFLEACSSMFHGLSYGALAFKAQAEILIFLGDNKGALQSCVDALRLDPKVSVKRMLNSLSKKLELEKNELRPSERVERLKISIEALRAKELKKMEENRGQINIKKDAENSMLLKSETKSADGGGSKGYYYLLIAILVVIICIWFLN